MREGWTSSTFCIPAEGVEFWEGVAAAIHSELSQHTFHVRLHVDVVIPIPNVVSYWWDRSIVAEISCDLRGSWVDSCFPGALP